MSGLVCVWVCVAALQYCGESPADHISCRSDCSQQKNDIVSCLLGGFGWWPGWDPLGSGCCGRVCSAEKQVSTLVSSLLLFPCFLYSSVKAAWGHEARGHSRIFLNQVNQRAFRQEIKKPPSDIKTVLKIGLENTGHGFSVVRGYFNILMLQETIKRKIPKSKG